MYNVCRVGSLLSPALGVCLLEPGETMIMLSDFYAPDEQTCTCIRGYTYNFSQATLPY